jgi:hypothetical protein
VLVQAGETREGKYASCCKFIEEGYDSDTCSRSNCVAAQPARAANSTTADGSSAVNDTGPHNAHRGTRTKVHSLNVPNNIRAEVANLPPLVRSLLFAQETNGKTLLERQFGVFVTIDDMDSLIIVGSSPGSVERCMLLVEEFVKNDKFALAWYRGERGLEMAHTLVVTPSRAAAHAVGEMAWAAGSNGAGF